MTPERYDAVFAEESELTPEEAAIGWHFCEEFDGLLIGPGMDEMKVCYCLDHWSN